MDLNLLVKPGIGAGFGLAAVFVSILLRAWRTGQWVPNLPSLLVAFLGGSPIPLGLALVLYPFMDKPPDLTSVVGYLPISGLAMLYLAFVSVKQAITQVESVPVSITSSSGVGDPQQIAVPAVSPTSVSMAIGDVEPGPQQPQDKRRPS